ncbi:MAG: S8 family serine peptidase [Fidelibacterota bacterium]
MERQILVGLKRGVTPADVDVFFEQIDVTVVKDFDRLKIALLETPVDGNLFESIQLLNQSPLIRYAEPNMVNYALQTHPNDRYYLGIPPAGYPHQWALNDTGQTPPGGTPDTDIDAPEGWDYETGNPNILVAILDSGIPMQNGTLSHPDLDDVNKIVLGEDYTIEPDGTVKDRRGHGTHVSGIVSAETDNSEGIAGVCWGCKILVIQVLMYNGGYSWDWFREGVYAAHDSSAKIINFSAGGPVPSTTAEEVVWYADSAGIFQSYSAGNDDSAGVLYPAKYAFVGHVDSLNHPNGYNSVVSVAATDYNDSVATYSSYNLDSIHISVAAPGGASDGGNPVDTGDIFSSMPNNYVILNGNPWYADSTYGYLAGTSMAAPHVSGLAALILSRFPN